MPKANKKDKKRGKKYESSSEESESVSSESSISDVSEVSEETSEDSEINELIAKILKQTKKEKVDKESETEESVEAEGKEEDSDNDIDDLEKIEKQVYTGLTCEQVEKLAKYECNVMTYDKLVKYCNDKLEEGIPKEGMLKILLGKYRALVIMYLSKEVNHFVLVKQDTYSDKQVIEYFDSFGRIENQILNEIPEKYRVLYKEQHPYVLNLIENGSCKWEVKDQDGEIKVLREELEVTYNDEKLQDDETAVCGRYCVVRLKYRDETLNKFIDMLYNLDDRDIVICELSELED